MLVDEERDEYQLRATYDDVSPLREYDSEVEDPNGLFTSKDHRAKLKFKRHIKRCTETEPSLINRTVVS